MTIEKEKLIAMYRMMVLTRRFEERLSKEFMSGNVPGNVHLGIGQEAIGVGACIDLELDDYVVSQHRSHGHAIVKGITPKRLMAEFFGKKTGCSMGRVGPLHVADASVGHLGAQAILGSQLPVAAGAALSAKMRGTDQVALCFLGDGTANTGRFHESLNLASIWNLPVVYIIESNMWAYCVPQDYSASVAHLADRACAYGIPGIVVDGNDVIAVYEAVGEAVARARRGEGPTLIECMTCRLCGHYEGDTEVYRDKKELDEGWEKEPIKRFRDKLIGIGVLTEKQATEIDQEALAEMDVAVKFAAESPLPDFKESLGEFYRDIDSRRESRIIKGHKVIKFPQG
jgi:pyruvate dehydrogenase E1 component alpha subunit